MAEEEDLLDASITISLPPNESDIRTHSPITTVSPPGTEEESIPPIVRTDTLLEEEDSRGRGRDREIGSTRRAALLALEEERDEEGERDGESVNLGVTIEEPSPLPVPLPQPISAPQPMPQGGSVVPTLSLPQHSPREREPSLLGRQRSNSTTSSVSLSSSAVSGTNSARPHSARRHSSDAPGRSHHHHQSGPPLSFAELYNRTVQALRDALIAIAMEYQPQDLDTADSTSTTGNSRVNRQKQQSQIQRQIVRDIFSRIDENRSGVLTIHEMKEFLLSPEISLFTVEEASVDSTCEKISQMILEQIDVNRDGNVSVSELEDFLFPENGPISGTEGGTGGRTDVRGTRVGGRNNKQKIVPNEAGIVVEASRKAVIAHVSVAAASGSDDAILNEFATLSKVSEFHSLSL